MERKYKSIEDIEERIDYLERAIFFEDMADRPNQDLIETHKRELKALEIITPADEKTHGFNRVDDSPQIF